MKPFQCLSPWLFSLLLVGTPTRICAAGEPNEQTPSSSATITLRGKSFPRWPSEALRELGFDLPEVADDENATWKYIEAINLYKDVPAELEEIFAYASGTGWPAEHGDKLARFLLEPANQRALELARRASAMEKIEPIYFGNPQDSIISVLLPNLSAYRHLAKMLVVDGRRLEAQSGYDEAIDNYLAAMRTGNHVAQGFTLIESLVAVACWSIGEQAVRELALRRDLDVEQLRALLTELDALAELRPGTVRGIENERRFGALMVEELVSRPFSFPANLGALAGGGGGDTGRPTESWGKLEAFVGKLYLPDRTIQAHLAAHYDQLIARARMPAHEARWREYDDEAALVAIPRWNVLARMLLPALTRAAETGERCRMQSQATRLVVALRLFAKEHQGAAPDRLAEINTWVPADEQIDPFSGKPFVYHHAGAAWKFYSVSENMLDDGGREGDDKFAADYVLRFPPPALEPFTAEESPEISQ